MVQDVIYKVYDANAGIVAAFRGDIKPPRHSATFNALGYNKVDYFTKSLFKKSRIESISKKLNNYYYKYDQVGQGFGNSIGFKRLGTDIGPLTPKDKDGK